MESIGFFLGTIQRPDLILSLYDGKARLVCSISENWGEVIVHSLKCGAKYARKLKRSIGMVYTEKEDLESLVTGSIGLKGIASLDSQISAKSSIELQLSRSEEIEEEFLFEAPKCGERIIALHQLRRHITFKYHDDRPFHKKDWSMMTTCWVDRIHDNSHVIPDVPECGCGEVSPNIEDGKVYIDMGNLSMTTGFIEDASKLRIPSLDIEIDKTMIHKTIQFPRSKLPKYLLFIGGDLPKKINAKISFRDAEIKDFSKFSLTDLSELEKSLVWQKFNTWLKITEESPFSNGYQERPITIPTDKDIELSDDFLEEGQDEKTEFDVVLKDPGNKRIEVIKEIRELTNLGLGEAFVLAQSSGSRVLTDVSKQEAKEAVRKLRSAGAEAEVE